MGLLEKEYETKFTNIHYPPTEYKLARMHLYTNRLDLIQAYIERFNPFVLMTSRNAYDNIQSMIVRRQTQEDMGEYYRCMQEVIEKVHIDHVVSIDAYNREERLDGLRQKLDAILETNWEPVGHMK
jgi:hypothetical protein